MTESSICMLWSWISFLTYAGWKFNCRNSHGYGRKNLESTAGDIHVSLRYVERAFSLAGRTLAERHTLLSADSVWQFAVFSQCIRWQVLDLEFSYSDRILLHLPVCTLSNYLAYWSSTVGSDSIGYVHCWILDLVLDRTIRGHRCSERAAYIPIHTEYGPQPRSFTQLLSAHRAWRCVRLTSLINSKNSGSAASTFCSKYAENRRWQLSAITLHLPSTQRHAMCQTA